MWIMVLISMWSFSETLLQPVVILKTFFISIYSTAPGVHIAGQCLPACSSSSRVTIKPNERIQSSRDDIRTVNNLSEAALSYTARPHSHQVRATKSCVNNLILIRKLYVYKFSARTIVLAQTFDKTLKNQDGRLCVIVDCLRLAFSSVAL